MVDKITITKVNEVYMRIETDRGIQLEIQDHFTFEVPGYRFMPSFRSGRWDGKIRLFDIRAKTMYAGLLSKLIEFAKDRDYEISCRECDFPIKTFTTLKAQEFIEKLNLPTDIVPYDYQEQTLIDAIQDSRVTFLSPTASGKSLMIYMISRYLNRKTLIIVPTIDLVNQFADDIVSYGGETPHRIFAEQDKNTDAAVTVSTWQSIYKLPKSWFAQFDVVFGDEVHKFKADSLVTLMTKLEQCKYRYGFTGTLDDSLTNKLVIEGLFGEVKVVTTTREMVDAGRASNFDVKCLAMQYSDDERKYASGLSYQDEIDFIITHPKRNEFIRKLSVSLKGNTLVIFNFVDKHGKVLYDLIKNSTDRPVYFVSGKVKGEERSRIRKIVETQPDAIIVASYGVFSTGINIPSLRNLIFTSPSKARIRVLQSIGRVLRKSPLKSRALIIDMADDLSWKKKTNFTLRHFAGRVKIYNMEQFDYTVQKVKLS